jgi:hypothetical protein
MLPVEPNTATALLLLGFWAPPSATRSATPVATATFRNALAVDETAPASFLSINGAVDPIANSALPRPMRIEQAV